MRLLRLLRSRAGRLATGCLLLATFLAGAGVAAWHLASTDGRQAEVVTSGDAPRAPTAEHHDQTCRVCAAAVASLLPAAAPVLAEPPALPGRRAWPLGSVSSSSSQFAGPLGSRAPPGPSSHS